MKIDREKAKKAGYTDEEINAFEAQLTTQTQPQQSGGVLGFLKGAAGFLAPRTTGVIERTLRGEQQQPNVKDRLLSLAGPLGPILFGSQGAKEQMGAAGEIASYMLPITKGLALTSKLGLAGATHGLTTPGASPVERGIRTVGEGVLGYGTGAVLGKVLPFARYPTKGMAARKTTQLAEEATTKGEGIDWRNLSDKIQTAVKKKFGDTQQVKRITDTLLGEKTPAAIEPMMAEPAGVGSTAGTFKISPSELLEWRRQILNRGGTSFLEKILRTGFLPNKIEGEARNVITKEFHKLVPKTVTPDKIYSFYSKIHGDAPTWGKRLLIGGAGYLALRKLLPDYLAYRLSGQVTP